MRTHSPLRSLALFAALVAAIGVVAGLTAGAAKSKQEVFPLVAADVECRQTFKQVEAIFSDPGDTFAYGPVEDRDAVARFVRAAGGSPEMAADARDKTEVIAVGHAARNPPLIVSLGFFDSGGCLVGSANGISLASIVKFLGPQTPVPHKGPAT